MRYIPEALRALLFPRGVREATVVLVNIAMAVSTENYSHKNVHSVQQRSGLYAVYHRFAKVSGRTRSNAN